MAEILGVGLTHYPGLLLRDEDMTVFLRKVLSSSRIPAEAKDPRNWPAPMQSEWADDRGTRAAAAHRARLVEGFRTVRRAIDSFKPDLMVIWGDDQFENFQDDLVPPFCVYAFDEVACMPFAVPGASDKSKNVWREPVDKKFPVRGHRAAGKLLAEGLLRRGFDVPYSYRPSYKYGLAHSFINTLMYLDYDRRGIDIPIVPIHVNCYGSSLVVGRSGLSNIGALDDRDPPSPAPERCFDLGATVAEIVAESPYRAVLVASSSWSHAFLTPKNNWLYPDLASDRKRYNDLVENTYASWRSLSLAEMEDAGQHEFLNWVCLAGAMTALGARCEVVDYLQTHAFNSNKCFALFRR